MTNKNEIVPVKSVNNVDITPVFNEIIEYAKDQSALGSLETIINDVLLNIREKIEFNWNTVIKE